MLIDSISGVIAALQEVITWSRDHGSRVGYFASLYLRVTDTIRSKIGTGYFEDDARMERLDVDFAQRYLTAVEQHRNGDPRLPAAWAVSFDATRDADLLVVQHLLLAMNPHINIDLGAAAAAVAPGYAIHDMKADFMKVNEILASIVPVTIREIGALSPLIHLLNDVAGGEEEAVANFSMKVAREAAWELAVELAPLDAAQQDEIIDRRNVPIAALGREIRSPGLILEGIVNVIAAVEAKDVVRIIDTLDAGNPDMDGATGEPSPRPAADGNPNHVYYFEVAPGRWTGRFAFKLKSWRALFGAPIGLKNKFLVALMALFQTVFRTSSISSTITPRPGEGTAGVAWNDFRIHKGFFTLFTSRESYTLDPNGTGVTVDAHVRFGPIPFLFREHDVYPAGIHDGGMRAVYHIKLLGGHFLGLYRVRDDRTQVESTLENAFAVADETLDKVS